MLKARREAAAAAAAQGDGTRNTAKPIENEGGISLDSFQRAKNSFSAQAADSDIADNDEGDSITLGAFQAAVAAANEIPNDGPADGFDGYRGCAVGFHG